MTYTVEASDITKSFGEHRALDGVDLRIEGGSVFGLLGPNGAGKTTMVRVLATPTRPGLRDGRRPRPARRPDGGEAVDQPDRPVRRRRRRAHREGEPRPDRATAPAARPRRPRPHH